MAEPDMDLDDPSGPVIMSSPDDPGAEVKGQEKAVCQYCNKTFWNKYLKEHTKRVHNVDTCVNKSKICCVFCNENFNTRIKLIFHLQKKHNHFTEKDSLQFKCKKDFEEWLANEEKNVTCQYVKRWGDKKIKDGAVGTYFCCQDGNRQHKDKGQRKRALKSQGYRQTGTTCTSHIVVRDMKLPQPRILVQYYKTHVGHQNHLKNMFLAKDEKENIARKISLGISDKRIIQDALKAANEDKPSRMDVLNKKDVANVRDCYGIGLLDGRMHSNEMLSVDMWVSRKMEEENCPTIPSKSCSKIKKRIPARQRVKTLIGSISASIDKLETLPHDVNSQIIHFLKAADVLIKSSPEQSVVSQGSTSSVAGKKRKLTKQAIFQKRVRDIQKKKKIMKPKITTNVSFTPGKNGDHNYIYVP